VTFNNLKTTFSPIQKRDIDAFNTNIASFGKR